jgi:hypothetical protein
MKKHFTVFLIFKKIYTMIWRSALGGKTLERALTLGKIRTPGARFCHRAPNARALSITGFKLLEYLELDFVNYRQFNSSIDDSLRTIAKKLLIHLKSFTTNSNLKVPQQDTIKGDLFPILGQFNTIEYLKIRHSNYNQRFGSIQCLKGCKSLKHLRIKSFRCFSDKEIEEYKLHLSGLKSLIINCFNRNFSL